jgi:hypothetical protein
LSEIQPAYTAFGKKENVGLDIHDEAQEIDLLEIRAFFQQELETVKTYIHDSMLILVEQDNLTTTYEENFFTYRRDLSYNS